MDAWSVPHDPDALYAEGVAVGRRHFEAVASLAESDEEQAAMALSLAMNSPGWRVCGWGIEDGFSQALAEAASRNFDGLPFGGVGDSGWGASHGAPGFLRFSHQKSVLLQSRWALSGLLYPPYGARFDRIMAVLRRWL